MGARIDSVAKFICEQGDWNVTNLQLQKLLYFAQMVHMGRNSGARLFVGSFEAWDYGPVEPSLYRRVRMYGSSPIEDVFFNARPFPAGDIRASLLNEVCAELLSNKPSDLVEITHWPRGAWAKHYEPGLRGIKIPDADILAEYRKRLETGNLQDD